MMKNLMDLQKLLTPENLSFFGASLLAFLVLSSKHIIIYNEETLVVISFIGFIYTCQKMAGDSIESSLNERSQAIATELLNFIHLKEQLVQELILEHKKQLSVNSFIKTLRHYSLIKITQIANERKRALKSLFMNQMEQKLKNLSSYSLSGSMSTKLQNAISMSFRGAVLEEFNRSKKILKPKFIQEAVNSLKKSS